MELTDKTEAIQTVESVEASTPVEASARRTPILSIRGVSKRLGGRLILNGINLDVYPGEIYGFLGPNGSGKTTTIKLILGLLKMEEGQILIDGHDVSEEFEAAVANVGGIIENPELYRYLTGRENLEQYARMYEGVTKERIDEMVRLVGLDQRIEDKISRYSLGMRQRLGLAQALLHRPKLLILDEPTNGLDPAGIKELRDLLKELSRTEQVAVFVSSHLLAELELMCDRVGVIDRGKMLGERSVAEWQDAFRDGKERLTLSVNDPVAAMTVAHGAGYACVQTKNGLTVSIEREAVPSLVRLMTEAGINIYEMSVIKKSLESAFLEMVGGTRPVGTGGLDESGKRVVRTAPSTSAAPVTNHSSEEDRL